MHKKDLRYQCIDCTHNGVDCRPYERYSRIEEINECEDYENKSHMEELDELLKWTHVLPSHRKG